jgi:DNA-binding transcriptional regulator LsrR (DeoR family)
VAFLGIGAFEGTDSSRLVYAGLLDPATTEQLRAGGAVGDVLCYVFDSDGTPITSGLEDRILAIGLDDLMRVPRRVGVASGAEKVAAIAGAVRGGFVNVLVTDRSVGMALCGERHRVAG